jgi:GntR family transcriptional regulator / MocR family aminotransferase
VEVDWAMIRRATVQADFELTPDRSLQGQVYQRIREAIRDGRLAPNARLPSTRSLSAQLSVARGTVDAAYGRLAGEGFIIGRGAAGTVVAPDVPRLPNGGVGPGMPATYSPPEDFFWPFRGGLPALDLVPRALWSTLATKASRRWDPQRLCYPDPRGLAELRAAIAAYLMVSRGISCDPAQVFVTSGYQAAQQLVTDLVLKSGDLVWLEDPGYRFAREALQSARMRPAMIPVDASGMDVVNARRHHPSARLAVVTPGHQSPLGVALTLTRRQALLDWAHAEDAWILEDDYDSEFHYRGRKPAALKSIDRRNRVFHAGSFSKSLFPGLRLGYLVAPPYWVEAATTASELRTRGLSAQDQMTLAAFMTHGHYARHLRRMRLRYAERSKALALALANQFRRRIELQAPEGGLTLLARFPGRRDVEMVALARRRQLAPSALSTHAVEHEVQDALLIGFTNVNLEDARAAARKLDRAIGGPVAR